MQWLRCDYNTLVDVLEPAIDVKMKEKLATILVAVFHKESLIQNFLTDILVAEINKLGMLRVLPFFLAHLRTTCIVDFLVLRYLLSSVSLRFMKWNEVGK